MKKTIFLVFRAAGSNPKASGFGIIGALILLVFIAYLVGENKEEATDAETVDTELTDTDVRRLGSTHSEVPSSEGSSEQCLEGQELTAGHCCWPGQEWSEGSGGSKYCFGQPTRCPEGYIISPTTCEPGCLEGKKLVAGHCCWPGQVWGKESQKCIGTAKPPDYCERVSAVIKQHHVEYTTVKQTDIEMCKRWKVFRVALKTYKKKLRKWCANPPAEYLRGKPKKCDLVIGNASNAAEDVKEKAINETMKRKKYCRKVRAVFEATRKAEVDLPPECR